MLNPLDLKIADQNGYKASFMTVFLNNYEIHR